MIEERPSFFKVPGKTGPKPQKPLKSGKRMAKRKAINIKLKKLWESLGIRSCELRLPGCLRDWAMGAAHSKKSRFLITEEDWLEAVLACPACHLQIESGKHGDMEKIVKKVIASRSSTTQDRPS